MTERDDLMREADEVLANLKFARERQAALLAEVKRQLGETAAAGIDVDKEDEPLHAMVSEVCNDLRRRGNESLAARYFDAYTAMKEAVELSFWSNEKTPAEILDARSAAVEKAVEDFDRIQAQATAFLNARP